MPNVTGYYGPTSLGPVNHNPLGSVVPNQIRLTSGEVATATRSLGMASWDNLNPAQQKMVAAWILQARGDELSQAQADQVLASNPAFQSFQIIAIAAAL